MFKQKLGIKINDPKKSITSKYQQSIPIKSEDEEESNPSFAVHSINKSIGQNSNGSYNNTLS